MSLQAIGKILGKDELVKYMSLNHFASDFGSDPRRLSEEKFIYLLVCVKQGNGNCKVDSDNINLQPGTVVIVNPFSYLHLENVLLVQGTVIAFTEDFLCRSPFQEQTLYKTVYGPNMRLFFQLADNEVSNRYISSLVSMFSWEYRIGNDVLLKFDLLHNMLYGIILYLHKLQLEREQSIVNMEEPLLKSQVVQFIQLLNTHFKAENSLQFYADKMNVTMKQLVQICKKGIGWSPKAIMQEKILREAKRLLLFEIMSIKEIGYELGFTEPTNFVKFFQQHTGISPKSFKIQHCVSGLEADDGEDS